MTRIESNRVLARRALELATAILTGSFGVAVVVSSLDNGIGWSSAGVDAGTFPFLTGIIIVRFAGFRGHKFTEPPLYIFPDMKDQAKVKYQQPSSFFEDGHANRPTIAGSRPGRGGPLPHLGGPDGRG